MASMTMRVAVDDDVRELPSCVVCGANLIFDEDTCSKACEDSLALSEAATGQCQWCHRLGPIGKPCIRKVPGTDEVDECGSFQ